MAIHASAWPRRPVRRGDLALAVVLFAAALMVRAPFILRGETLLHSDEAIVGLMAQDVAEGTRFPLYFYGQRYMGALEAYVIAALLPFCEAPITALRLGPALFFAALLAVQYLMLARWFGRAAACVGALMLLAAAPMFVQWSVSARGGYIEILLWGSLLLWTYGEWFVRPPLAASRGKRLVFGLIIGSGLWINPTIMLFIVPVAAHALLDRPLSAAWDRPALARFLSRLGWRAGPVVVVAAVLANNVVSSVWVESGRVKRQVLLGLFPQPVALVLFAAAGIVLFTLLLHRTRALAAARRLLDANGMLIFGVVIGATPAILYVVGRLVRGLAMEPALPLGLRPLWRTAETFNYLITGLPLLFAADSRDFLRLVGVGRDYATLSLPAHLSRIVTAADWLVAGSLLTLLLAGFAARRDELRRLFSLRPGPASPFVLLFLGIAGMLSLYVLGGCTIDFTTIRYLVPMWAFIPGLIAAIIVHADSGRPVFSPLPARLATTGLLLAWGVGQFAMHAQLGRPHPLRAVADELVARDIRAAFAEPLDAHLLSYLTGQRCRVAEFESFWPRLAHLQAHAAAARPVHYVVDTTRTDWTDDWTAAGWPGKSPPETRRFLWPRLEQFLDENPSALVARSPLVGRYSLVSLDRAVPQRPPPD